MTTRRSHYLRHRFPQDIISHAVWLYHRYCLSFRDVEDLMVAPLKRRQGRLGDTWFVDEVFVMINGQRRVGVSGFGRPHRKRLKR